MKDLNPPTLTPFERSQFADLVLWVAKIKADIERLREGNLKYGQNNPVTNRVNSRPRKRRTLTLFDNS